MNFYLLPSIEFGPLIIERLLALLPPEKLDTALHEDRFTPREVFAHLADWEPIMRERIRMALATPGAVIPGHDEGQMAIDHGYAQSNPAEQCALFRRERHLTAELLRGLETEDWQKTVTHTERGAQSVEDLANLLLGHDLYHIEQLTEHLGS